MSFSFEKFKFKKGGDKELGVILWNWSSMSNFLCKWPNNYARKLKRLKKRVCNVVCLQVAQIAYLLILIEVW
jgi:hypothetical protein